MDLKEKIKTAKIRQQELQLLIDAWEETLPKKKFGEKNDHVEPTIDTPMGKISETLMSGSLGDYYKQPKEEHNGSN
tara:strand:+ start:1931 stop:2158 length:228 start_codon:yes stop_codon:yes gene_type:complete